MNRRLILGVLGGFVSGTGVGAIVTRFLFESKLKESYEAQAEVMKRAYEKALELHMADRAEEPETSPSVDINEKAETRPIVDVELPDVVEAPEEAIVTPTVNPYHAAVAAPETTTEDFVSGVANAFGISYIEDEDYLDEDGRFKGRIDIMIGDDQEPVFLMDGVPTDDWARRIGESILVDFYKLVPPGIEPILYVRNHRTDEDYEVALVSP